MVASPGAWFVVKRARDRGQFEHDEYDGPLGEPAGEPRVLSSIGGILLSIGVALALAWFLFYGR